MAFVWPFRLEGPLEPGGGGGAAGEGVRVARGLLQTQIPRPARQVSSLCPSSHALTPCKPPAMGAAAPRVSLAPSGLGSPSPQTFPADKPLVSTRPSCEHP